MTTTTPTITEQLQTLRANAGRDLETWRGVLAEFEARVDVLGAVKARMSINRVETLLLDIKALLRNAEATNA